MSTSSEEGSAYVLAGQIVAGVLVAAGVAAIVWLAVRRTRTPVDPQVEIDRRLEELDRSLSRLQEVFGYAVSG